jgi:hypothetical protein
MIDIKMRISLTSAQFKRQSNKTAPSEERVPFKSLGLSILFGCETWKFYGEKYWLIYYLLFYVPLKNFSLIWRRYGWRAAKFRPMLGAQGLWAGRDLYRAIPAVAQGLGFSGLIRRTTLFSRLLRHATWFEHDPRPDYVRSSYTEYSVRI